MINNTVSKSLNWHIFLGILFFAALNFSSCIFKCEYTETSTTSCLDANGEKIEGCVSNCLNAQGVQIEGCLSITNTTNLCIDENGGKTINGERVVVDAAAQTGTSSENLDVFCDKLEPYGSLSYGHCQ